MAMKIVDSQVHIWYPDTPERPWPPAIPSVKPHRERPFVLEDLLAEMRGAGVDRAILTPLTFDGARNDKVLEAARLYPDRFAVMGRLLVNDPEIPGKIATWKQQPGMLGVRVNFFLAEHRECLSNGAADWFWPAAEKAGVGIMIYVPGNLPPVRHIAKRCPSLKLIVDHMGSPHGSKDDAAFVHIGELCSLARFPNVAVKVSALPVYSNEPYPHPKLHSYLKRAYDVFGPRRLFWGSDLTRLQCSYRLSITMITEEMKWLSSFDLEWIMGRGVCEWLGWPLPE